MVEFMVKTQSVLLCLQCILFLNKKKFTLDITLVLQWDLLV